MDILSEQILEAWRTHHRVMLMVIENIPDEALSATLSTRGGRDIARQLAHLHMVRAWQVEELVRKLTLPLIRFEKDESPDKARLLEAFEQSGLAFETYIEQALEKGGKVKRFQGGVVAMLGYYISHEAHHRGTIFLTMKQCGFKISEPLKWGIWDWNKIQFGS